MDEGRFKGGHCERAACHRKESVTGSPNIGTRTGEIHIKYDRWQDLLICEIG